MRSLHIETKSSPCSPQLEKSWRRNGEPAQPKISKSLKKKKSLKKIGVQSTRSVTEAGSFPLYEASQMLGDGDLSQRFIYKAAP